MCRQSLDNEDALKFQQHPAKKWFNIKTSISEFDQELISLASLPTSNVTWEDRFLRDYRPDFKRPNVSKKWTTNPTEESAHGSIDNNYDWTCLVLLVLKQGAWVVEGMHWSRLSRGFVVRQGPGRARTSWSATWICCPRIIRMGGRRTVYHCSTGRNWL